MFGSIGDFFFSTFDNLFATDGKWVLWRHNNLGLQSVRKLAPIYFDFMILS